MADIHAYRRIVEVQQEIVKLSRQNDELEQRCKQLKKELILQHQKQTAPSRFHVAIGRRSLRSIVNSIPGVGLFRPGNLAPLFERLWQAILP
jgi:hypothetical protein